MSDSAQVSPDESRTDRSSAPTAIPDKGSAHLFVGADHARIVISGEIDVLMSRELTDVATEALETGLPVDVDTRTVTFMDSSAVATLAWLASRSPDRVRMIQPPDMVRFVLDVTNVGDIVDIVDHDPGAHGSEVTAGPGSA